MKTHHRIFSCILVIFIVVIVGFQYRLTRAKGFSNEQTFSTLEEAVASVVEDNGDNLVPTEFSVSPFREVSNWVYGAYSYTLLEKGEYEAAPVGSLFIAHINDNQWTAATLFSNEFQLFLDQIPNGLLTSQELNVFRTSTYDNEDSPNGGGSSQLSLPWHVGQSWYLNQGPHPYLFGGTGIRNSLDLNGFPQTPGYWVTSARDGIAWVDNCNGGNPSSRVIILHDNGWQTSYLHLQNIQIPANTSFLVNRGQNLGQTSAISDGCGTAGGPHLHFSLMKDGSDRNLDGEAIGGWAISAGTASGAGCLTTNGLPDVCYPPQSSGIYNSGLIGDETPPPSCGRSPMNLGDPCNDTIPPTGSFTSPQNGTTINDSSVIISAIASDDAAGSGVYEVSFSAKWNGQWHGIANDSSEPYSINWDMCQSGVSNGDIELGLQVTDNAGNVFVYSTTNPNPHIIKNYNCVPPPGQDGVYVYQNTGQGGAVCYLTQDAPSIGNYCGSSWNDDIESVRVQGSYYFAMFIDDNFSGGAPLTGNFTGDLPNEWRNQVSSIRIRRSNPSYVTLWSLGDWNGERFDSDRALFDLGHWGFNDMAESISVASGYEVIICEHSDFHGICGRTDHNVSDINAVAQGLRDAVSSFRACPGHCPPTPSTPTNVAPSDNITIEPGTDITLQWSGNGMQYFIEYWGGDLPNPVQMGWNSNTTWNLGILPPSDNPYRWHVKSWNENGESDWSTHSSFYIAYPSIPGDVNSDSIVNIFDYNSVVSNFGWTGNPGEIPSDIDTDGDVDIYDYNIMIDNFGVIYPSSKPNNLEFVNVLGISPPFAPSNLQIIRSYNELGNATLLTLHWDDNAVDEDGFIISWNVRTFGKDVVATLPNPPNINFRPDTTSAKIAIIPCGVLPASVLVTAEVIAFNEMGSSSPATSLAFIEVPSCSNPFIPTSVYLPIVLSSE